MRGVLTTKSSRGCLRYTATGGKGHGSIDQRNIAQVHDSPCRRQIDSEQSQLARHRTSARDCLGKRMVAQAATVLAAARDDRSAPSHRQRFADFNSDSSVEDQQEVEARSKRSLRRARAKEHWRASAAARAAAAVVTAATLAAPSDQAVASAVVAAAEKAVHQEREAVGDPKKGSCSVRLHSHPPTQMERPQRPLSRPAYCGRQSMAGNPIRQQEMRDQSPARAHSPESDPAASIDDAIATIDKDLAATSAYIKVLDVKLSESKLKLAAVEKARAEQFGKRPREGDLTSAAKAKELANEHEEGLGKAYFAVRSGHQDQFLPRAPADRRDSESNLCLQETSGTVAAAPPVAANDPPGRGSPSTGEAYQLTTGEGGFDGALSEASSPRASLNITVGQPVTGQTEETATASRLEPSPSTPRHLQLPFGGVPLYPWDDSSPIFKHAY